MIDAPNPNASLYCFPVEKKGNRFIEAAESNLLGLERPKLHQLRGYLGRNHISMNFDVELKGKTYRTKVFVAKQPDDLSYVIADIDGIPVDVKHTTNQQSLNRVTTQNYFEKLQKELSFSEAISPHQVSYLKTEFMVPSFLEIDVNHQGPSTTRTWREVKTMPRVVILGQPGAGKTTCLRKLVLEETEQIIKHPERVPIYIQLRKWTQEAAVHDNIKRELVRSEVSFLASNFESLAETGNILLVLDGLDEVESTHREKTREAILDFATSFPRIGIVISMRKLGYNWPLPGFTHVEIQPFSENKIKEWTYQKLYSEEDKSWRVFFNHLSSQSELLTLAKNPLMLTLALYLFRYNSIIPQSKATLIEYFVDALVDIWDSVRGVNRSTESWASSENKIKALCRSAFAVRLTETNTFTEQDFLRWQLSPTEERSDKQLLKALVAHTGLVEYVSSPVGESHITFTHQLIADYLAARYLVESTEDITSIFQKQLNKHSWQNIWELACSLTHDSTQLVSLVLENDNLDEISKATLLARAFAQNIKLDSKLLIKSCYRILKTLENTLQDFEIVNHDVAKQSWRLVLSSKDTRFPEDFAEYTVSDLITAIYETRDSIARNTLQRLLDKSKIQSVAAFASFFEINGELQQSSYIENNLWTLAFSIEVDHPFLK